MSSSRHDRSRPSHEQSRDKSRSRRDNDPRGPHRDRDSGRSISRDSRTQDAAQRGSDAHPDALRQQSRPPTASSKEDSTSQSAQAPPAAQARPASGVLGAGHRTVFALEAARLLKQKAALSPCPAAVSAATSEAAEDPEDGELPEAPEEAASKRRKHSPIVWSGVPKRSADAAGDTSLPSPPNLDNSPVSGLTGSPARGLVQAGNAAGRAAAELAEFQNRQMLDDIDPDAPAAMKASPSVSGESGAGDIGNGVTSAAVTMSLGPGVTVHATVTATGGGADTALANVLDAAAAVTQPRNKWEAAMSEEEAAGADLSEEAHMAALNARERKEIAEGQGLQTPEHDGDPMQTDGSPEFDVTTAPSMLQQCRSVQNFERLNCINEGTYGMVYRARETASGKILALKKIKMEREKEGFPLTSIREINILLALHHKNIVNVTEVVVGKKMDDIFMVMEFMEHDLKGLMEAQDASGPVFAMSEIKCLMHQLILGVEYLHKNWVIHRDLKTSNILYNNKGDLKICDFGLARQYGSPLRPYTHMVVTLWYRAPELLLGVKEYSTAIDMWSVGCIMGELILNKPLLPGKSEMEQIHKTFSLVGTPTAENWPKHTDLPNLNKFKFPPTQPKLSEKFPVRRFDFDGRSLSEAGFELLNGLLTLDPERRFTAEQARNHRWFKEQPYSKDLAMMPTFPVKQGEGSHHRKVQKVHKRQDSPRDP